ncbi:uncharacterized protein LACBIDRAFT_308498 [Laccaria bicolor S238N-H82]|uniref:Predicted protein n=1 Tax=Laccaria bicolor (strain S238N-H82 / ATCC MYA-4686) TaxID=486041 RepID=B0CWH4_LACBS|nr:uncharacterized protein LACBIDRAFT_308498 [Laccaria bicolor S238N-H82]EDR13069.1 predicted protein [Laccaria bicolor S238N-H82]|eukprot:XP_001875567.1 predicted protein [Laccaria bicolor S238N-H82]
MPEISEVLVWERLLNRKRSKKRLFCLLISPLGFSIGSEKQCYTTLTATKGSYTSTILTKAALPLPTWVSAQRKHYAPWPPKLGGTGWSMRIGIIFWKRLHQENSFMSGEERCSLLHVDIMQWSSPRSKQGQGKGLEKENLSHS